jgi:hypothetical protein
LTNKYLVINTLGLEYLSFKFAQLLNSNLDAYLTQKLEEQLQGIDPAIIGRIKNNPLLKSCSDIDLYYTT